MPRFALIPRSQDKIVPTSVLAKQALCDLRPFDVVRTMVLRLNGHFARRTRVLHIICRRVVHQGGQRNKENWRNLGRWGGSS